MFLNKLKEKISHIRFRHMSPGQKSEYLRDKVYYMGNNVKIFTEAIGTEPYLLSIHDNVNVAAGVKFLNHDVSCFNVSRYLNLDNPLDKVGSITLHENCMVGAYSILMPGCSVGKNSIVAAGSVVTKHIPANEVWGGVPAKFIMTIDEYADKLMRINENYPWRANGKAKDISSEELMRARMKYFFEK